MVQEKQNAFAIGLYSYKAPNPGSTGFKMFYDFVVSNFKGIGITPTYFAAVGAGYRGDLTRIGGRTHAKALKSDFSDVHVLSLVANPDASDEPGYDSFASVSLGFVEETGETLLCYSMEERFLEFGGNQFKSILQTLVNLSSWDFGYALSQPIEKKPEFHIMGLDGGKLSKEELLRLNKWYSSSTDERVSKIRDAYRINIVNEVQLNSRILGSQRLVDMIKNDHSSSLSRFENSELWLWEVAEDKLGLVREKLVGSDVLIT